MGFRLIRKSCFICLFAFPLIGCKSAPPSGATRPSGNTAVCVIEPSTYETSSARARISGDHISLVLPNGESLDFDGCDIGAEADPAFLGACEDRTGREWQFVGKPTLPPPEYGADGPIDCYWIP